MDSKNINSVIIAGSRGITNYSLVKEAIKESGFKIKEIVSGGAIGVDSLGERYAKENNIPLNIFYARWDLFGKRAGRVRNEEMARNADALIAIHDGISNGTRHMIEIAKQKGLKVYVKVIN